MIVVNLRFNLLPKAHLYVSIASLTFWNASSVVGRKMSGSSAKSL